jgi:CheY-like chemotaxis protein
LKPVIIRAGLPDAASRLAGETFGLIVLDPPYAPSAAADALAAVAQHPTGIDVVLTDIGMPGADGYTLLRELRKLPPESGGRVPAIAVTAYATSEDRHHALKAGFVAHIGKPFAPLTLISTIARAAGTAA